MQDVVERIWDFIDDFNINSVLKFLKDNVVGTVVVISLIFWVPISCLISYVDKKRAKKVKKIFKYAQRGTGFSDMDAGHLTLFGFQMT